MRPGEAKTTRLPTDHCRWQAASSVACPLGPVVASEVPRRATLADEPAEHLISERNIDASNATTARVLLTLLVLGRLRRHSHLPHQRLSQGAAGREARTERSFSFDHSSGIPALGPWNAVTQALPRTGATAPRA